MLVLVSVHLVLFLDSLVPTSCSTCLSCIYVVLYCVCRGGGLIPPASFRTGVMPHWRFLPLLVSPGSVLVTVAQSAKCKVCYLWRNVFHFDGSMRDAPIFNLNVFSSFFFLFLLTALLWLVIFSQAFQCCASWKSGY